MSTATPADGTPVWQLNPRIRLTWRDWGHDSVAYDSLSGVVHVFDPLAAAVVSWLEQQPHDAPGLCERLAADAPGTRPADFADGVGGALELLAGLGWAEPGGAP